MADGEGTAWQCLQQGEQRELCGAHRPARVTGRVEGGDIALAKRDCSLITQHNHGQGCASATRFRDCHTKKQIKNLLSAASHLVTCRPVAPAGI